MKFEGLSAARDTKVIFCTNSNLMRSENANSPGTCQFCGQAVKVRAFPAISSVSCLNRASESLKSPGSFQCCWFICVFVSRIIINLADCKP